jgi:hypothetical protein
LRRAYATAAGCAGAARRPRGGARLRQEGRLAHAGSQTAAVVPLLLLVVLVRMLMELLSSLSGAALGRPEGRVLL